MATEQMGMPAAAPSPEEMAVFDQMRQTVSPKEFSDEMLAGAAQVDPQAVDEFKRELEGLDIPPEVLDALNDVVDEILAKPEQYEELRQQYMGMGLPEDILPEQFDPHFFAALNMAIDQMIAAPAGPQAFAQGGIAELKPIAKAIASYGRNGDTMLAHITPAEARMLRRRGGSGTINPDTGLPEFSWLSKGLRSIGRGVSRAFKSVGNAVKKFVGSTVGRLITTVALGFFLGPAAASMLGVSSAAGVAAVSGFVGSAGSTLLGGGSIRDALKAGAVGGLTAGVGAGVMGGTSALQAGSYTGPTTIGGQWDRVANMLSPAPGGTPSLAQAPTGTAPAPDMATATGAPSPLSPESAMTKAASLPTDGAAAPFDATAAQGSLAKTVTPPSSSLLDTAKDFYSKNISPSGIQQAGTQSALDAVKAQFPGVTTEQIINAPAGSVLAKAYSAATPGILSTYGPAVGAGLGIMGLAGGFNAKPLPSSALADELKARDARWGNITDNPSQYYVQNLPGVVYDEKGAIIGSKPWSPTATLADVQVPSTQGGIGGLSPLPSYAPPPDALGYTPRVQQPYNTASMYTNLMPRYAADGGLASLAQGGYPRRTGQISGPGTETSDSIPAMLSDGEFVMTAKAVKGAGNGSRRAGAKKMYALMHQLERNAARG
jgi:hypothetical protein